MELVRRDDNEEEDAGWDKSLPKPCLFFFDSLHFHSPRDVRKLVIQWLNAEWKRLGKSSNETPFKTPAFQIVRPKGTCPLVLQEGGCNTGYIN
jgi:hypothetical protein